MDGAKCTTQSNIALLDIIILCEYLGALYPELEPMMVWPVTKNPFTLVRVTDDELEAVTVAVALAYELVDTPEVCIYTLAMTVSPATNGWL